MTEINNDLTKTTVWENRKAILICTVVATASFQYGLDVGLIGGFQSMTGFLEVFGYRDPATLNGWNLTSTVQQLITSLMTLGAFVGSLLAGPVSTYLNRRMSICLASVLCIVSTFILIFTTSLGALYFARLLLGIANGFFMTFSQLYIQECSAPHMRGVMLVMFEAWINLGSCIGTIIDNYTAPIAGRHCYQIPLALLFIFPTLLIVVAPFIPDSPRWLIAHNKPEASLSALRRLRGSAYREVMILEEFQEIKESWQVEEELAKSSTILDMFRGTDLRRTLLSVAAVCFQASSGGMFLIMYGTYFFEMSGSTQPFQDSVIVSCLSLISIIGMFVIIRYLGRRGIMLITTTVQGFCMLIMAIVYTVAPTSSAALKCLVAFVCIYTFFYGGLAGPTAWLIAGEIPSQRLRSYTLGLGSAAGFVLGWLAAFTAPYFINPQNLNWGPKYGYIWFPSNIITTVFVFFFIPETKDRTLEEIDEMFHNRVAPRKFKSYECVVSQQAREHGVEKLGEKETSEHVETAIDD